VIPDGERHKTTDTWRGILDTLLEARLDRHSVVIAFGGGVVGDITGFAAAAFLRGVDYVQVPTTLLAMVDSSVGGKTGVNHPCGKNLIGAFHQPCMVWVDLAYLDTLPRREFIAGYAELFKNAFIGGPDMFAFVRETHQDLIAAKPDALAEGVERSIRIKAGVVQEDEHESGRRALLNFGHTFAHALEQTFHYEGILHGEAVLWGMACACDLGKRIGTVPPAARAEMDELIGRMPLPALEGVSDAETLYEAMFSDKKARGGTLRFVLPAEPGVSVVRADVPKSAVLETLRTVIAR
jgi:3-dehydroquinate synthase